MTGDEFVLDEEFFKFRVKIAVSSPHVSKGSGAPGARRRKLVGKQQGVTSAPRIEAGVSVEEGIALAESAGIRPATF
jgi:hypothetical protein